MEMQTGNGVLVHCEISDGRLAPVATEALGAGSRLATALGQELSAVLIGAGVGGPAQEAIAYGATTSLRRRRPLLAGLRYGALSPGHGDGRPAGRPGHRAPGPDPCWGATWRPGWLFV